MTERLLIGSGSMDRISSALAAILVGVATPADAGPLLLSPLSFDFGYIYAGATSPTQVVAITKPNNQLSQGCVHHAG